MGSDVQVDIYFHHFNVKVFQKLIEENNGNYTKYIIMPTNLQGIAPILNTLPAEEVYILDQTNPELAHFPSISQNFVKDIYNALLKGLYRLDRYQKLILIFPGFREPIGMKIGFEKFCIDYNFDYEIISEFNKLKINSGEVFIIPNDRDLVQVIEQSEIDNLKIGQDFGIISYNETPLKKVVANGITTISTNFERMGEILAQMVLENKKDQLENECQLILRKSL